MLIGFANGCFWGFHEGHRHFLTNCRKHCEYLIVAVNTDEYCQKKHPGGTVEPLKQRMFHVRAYAEAAIPFNGREDNLLMEIRPDVVFKGYDHSSPDKIVARSPGWKENGGLWQAKVVKISHLPGFSTTEMLNAPQ